MTKKTSYSWLTVTRSKLSLLLGTYNDNYYMTAANTMQPKCLSTKEAVK